jgi:hypothetical protein
MLQDSYHDLGEIEVSKTLIVTVGSINHPIDSAIHFQEAVLPGLTFYPGKYRAFWSQFQHKFMTYWAIRQVYAKGDQSEEMRTNLNRCQEEVKKLCRETISVTHPQEAAILAQSMGRPQPPSKA